MILNPDRPIEWFELKDLTAILRVYYSIINTVSEKAFFNWSESAFIEELKISKTLVLNEGNCIQSFISFRENEDRIEIMVLGTHTNAQKKGLMHILFCFLQDYATQQRKEICLEAHERNTAACRLYLKNGFKLSHKRKNYYIDGSAANLYVWKK